MERSSADKNERVEPIQGVDNSHWVPDENPSNKKYEGAKGLASHPVREMPVLYDKIALDYPA